MAGTRTNPKNRDLFIGPNAANAINTILLPAAAGWNAIRHIRFKPTPTVESSPLANNYGAFDKGRINGPHSCDWELEFAVVKPTAAATEIEQMGTILDNIADQSTNAATTVKASPSPTTTSFELTSATSYAAAQMVRVDVTGGADQGAEVRLLHTLAAAVGTFYPPFSTAPTAADVVNNGLNWTLFDDAGVANQDSMSMMAVINTRLVAEGVVGGVVNNITFRVDAEGFKVSATGMGYMHYHASETNCNGSVSASATDTDIELTRPGAFSAFAYYELNANGEYIQNPDYRDEYLDFPNQQWENVTRNVNSAGLGTASAADTAKPAVPTASYQTTGGEIPQKECRVRVYDIDTAQGGLFEYVDFEVSIDRQIVKKSYGGTASDMDAWTSDGWTISWSMTGDETVDNDNDTAGFYGYSLQQRNVVLVLEAGLPSLVAGGSGWAIGMGAAHVLVHDTSAFEEGSGSRTVTMSGEVRRPTDTTAPIAIAQY